MVVTQSETLVVISPQGGDDIDEKDNFDSKTNTLQFQLIRRSKI